MANKSKKSRGDKLRDMLDRPRTDPYAVLGVSRNATDDEVKDAYRDLARKHHPDRNPGDQAAEERFKEVSEAYSVLSDPDKRAYFDRYGVNGGRRKEPPKRETYVTYEDYEPPYRKKGPSSTFVGTFNGVAHYHHGNVLTCIVCGFGMAGLWFV